MTDPVERNVIVYERQSGGPLLVRGFSMSIRGNRIQYGPHYVVERDPGEVGRVVIEALRKCSTNVPDKKDWRELSKDDQLLLAQAGVRTFAGFHAKVRAVYVEDNGARLRVVPTSNVGRPEGIQYEDAKAIQVPHPATSKKLGSIVLRGLSRSTFLE